MTHAGIQNSIGAELLDAWKRVNQAEAAPELVLLEGSAGLGKTHLSATLRRELAGQPAAQGVQSAVIAPGNLIGALLRSLPGLLSRRDAAFVSAARPHVPDHSWPAVIHTGSLPDAPSVLARAISEQVSPQRPLLLIVEDLHDQTTQDRAFLDTLWARLLLDSRPALLVVTTRPTADYPEAASSAEALNRTSQLIRGQACLHVTLTPLTAQGVAELLRVHLGDHPPSELASWLYAHAEGHPLRSVELLHVLQDRGALTHHGHHWHFQEPPAGSLPASLNAVLHARLQAVKPQAKPWQALAALAVLDAPTGERAWRQVAGLGTEVFQAARDWLLHRQLIRLHPTSSKDAQYLCGHPLYPPLLRAELDWDTLQALHTRAANADLDGVARARHARHADHPDAQALTLAAMRLAQSRAAHQDVIREARALLEEQAEHQEASIAIVQALGGGGQWQEVLLECEQLPASMLSNALVQVERAQALHELARLDEAAQVARQALTQHEFPAGSVLQTRLEDTLYRALVNAGHMDQAQTDLELALEHLPPSEPRWAGLVDLMAYVYRRKGDYLTAYQLVKQVLDRGLHGRNPKEQEAIHTTAGGFAAHLSLWHEAEVNLTQALNIATREGLTWRISSIQGNLAYLCILRGEYVLGEQQTWTQYHRAVATQNARLQGVLLWNLGICRLWRGDPERAQTYMEQSLERWNTVAGANATDIAECLAFQGDFSAARNKMQEPDHDFYPDHPNSRARIHLLLGEEEQALTALQAIKTENGPGLTARQLLITGQVYLRLNEIERASSVLQDALNLTRKIEHRSVQGEVLLTQAVLAYRNGLPSGPQLWNEGLNLLAQTDGQGHLKFVQLLFPTEVERLSSRVAHAPAAVRRARLRLLGNVQVEYPDGLRPWKARKVKELLGLLVCAYYSGGRQSISRDRLVFDLWPEADEQGAESSFRKTVTRLREALADAATLSRTADGEYQLQDVNADLDAFLHALHGQRDAEATAAYTAPFLNDLDLTAAQELREHLHEQYRAALLRLARNDPQAAQPHLQMLLSQDALDLEVTTTLLHVHTTLGQMEAHTKLLRRARTLYQTTLGEVPAELSR